MRCIIKLYDSITEINNNIKFESENTYFLGVFIYFHTKMPADFIKCENNGGKMRTQSLSDSRYRHICIDSSGKVHLGEIKVKKSKIIKRVRKSL